MKKMKSLVAAISSLFLLPALAYGKDVRPEQAGMAMMRLQASLFSTGQSGVQGGSLWSRLRENFRIGEVNSALVRSHESKFAANSAYFNRTLDRSRPYMYHITSEVKKRGMPAEIALLPFIESAYVTKAKSHVGASGLWQFMPATGRHYGLEQTPMYDGRHDVYAATDAALNYLQYLHGLFGDWSLALAAYNWGEGNVSRAIRRAQSAGLEPTYENLKMPAETRNYVPKLLAVRNLVNNPQAFGLRLPELEHKPYFATVNVDTPLDIMAAAHLANISEDEFLALNPAFKTPVFLPKTSRKMLLPVSAVKTFENNYRNSDAKTLLSWDVFTPDTRMDLNTIAQYTGSSVGDLKRLNGITTSYVNPGRSLLVNKNTASALSRANEPAHLQLARSDIDTVPDTYVEQAPVLGPKAETVFVAQTAQPKQPEGMTANNQSDDKQAIPPVALAAPAPAIQTATIQTAAIQPAAEPVMETAQASSTLTDSVPTDVRFAQNTTAESTSVPTLAETAATAQTLAEAENPPAVTQADTLVEADPLIELARAAQDKLKMEQALAKVRTVAEQAAATKAQPAATAAKAQSKDAAKQTATAEGRSAAAKRTVQTAKAEAKPAPAATHKVGNGDTLYSIAKRYNIDVADLVAANGIKGNTIRSGQVLKVSATSQKASAKTTAGKRTADRKAVIPASYTVRKGDTLQAIAERYNLKVADIKKLNKNSSSLKAGQKIKLTPS